MTDAVELTEAEWWQVDTALTKVPELIRDAAASLDFVADGIDTGAFDARDCAGLLRLAARGLRSGEAGELAALGLVERELRCARSEHLEARRQAQTQAEAKGVSPAVREACMKMIAEEEISHADQP